MNGSVVKKGNRWYVIIEQRDPETGNRKRKWHSGYRTKREAEVARAELVVAFNRNSYMSPSSETFEAFAINWLSTIANHLKPSSMASYELQVRRALPRIGHLKLQEIGPVHLDRLYSYLLTSGRANNAGGLSPTSVQRVHAVLHRLFRDATRKNHLATNPADLATPPPQRPAHHQTWSAAELSDFLHHNCDGCQTNPSLEPMPTGRFDETRLFAAFRLSAMTGLRRGELLALKWSDVDLVRRSVSVNSSLVTIGHKVVESTPKSAHSRRTIALDSKTMRALQIHAERQAEEISDFGGQWPGGNLLFTSSDGSPVHPNSFSQLFKTHVAATQLPRIRLHDLRHTHATLALAAGHNAKVVSERLGHWSVAFTLQTYAHVLPGMQQALADDVSELVAATIAVEDR